MRNVLNRLYQTKTLLGVVLLVSIGGALLVVGQQAARSSGLSWLPLEEIGGILIGAGILSVWLDRFLQREQDALDELRLRRLLQEHAPTMRDAVLQAFAANHEDLERVATPETLDRIIGNSLALRLGDQQFAHEVYADIRDQAISATERWHDANLSIELSPLPEDLQRKHPDLFAVSVRWEYVTIPHHAQRQFVYVSDREEYADLAGQSNGTSAWYLKPPPGMSAADRQAFELLRFAVDGEERPIRRSKRKTGQTYTASLGPDVVAAGEPVTITYTYRTLTNASGHLLFFDIEQPTRDLRVDFDYGQCDIDSVSTLDLVPSLRRTRIEHNPEPLQPGTIRVDLDGWIFPRSGVAFVWTLSSEGEAGGRATANGTRSRKRTKSAA